MSQHKILCGSCRCPVEAAANPKPHDNVTCPRCGRKDRFDKVLAVAKEHAVYLAHKGLAEHLTKSTRSNSFIQFKPQHIPHRSFRWMIEGKVF